MPFIDQQAYNQMMGQVRDKQPAANKRFTPKGVKIVRVKGMGQKKFHRRTAGRAYWNG